MYARSSKHVHLNRDLLVYCWSIVFLCVIGEHARRKEMGVVLTVVGVGGKKTKMAAHGREIAEKIDPARTS